MVTKEKSLGTRAPGRTVAGGGDPFFPERPDPNDGSAADPMEYEASFSKSKLLAGFLLLVVVMTFSGVIGAYIVIATNGVLEWKAFERLPFQVWISTLIILASSVTYVLAERAIRAVDASNAKKWLMVTTVLGAAFVSSQIIVWYGLVQRGVYMQSNPYAGFFYILTALHAVHVAGGIVALGYISLLSWERVRFEASIARLHDIVGPIGWYWHFMGGLWIVLLVLLGFWK